jgi:hypothetical protein
MGRQFAMGWAPITAQVAKSEAARDSIVDSMADKMGVDRKEMDAGVENCQRFIKAQGHDATPSRERGTHGPALVRGNRYEIISEHTNGHGDKVLEMARPVGGGRFERISVREAQAEQHSRVVAEVRGGR